MFRVPVIFLALHSAIRGTPASTALELCAMRTAPRTRKAHAAFFFFLFQEEDGISDQQKCSFFFCPPLLLPCLHPLCGGIPIDRAWWGLELYADRVLGALADG